MGRLTRQTKRVLAFSWLQLLMAMAADEREVDPSLDPS
jgi:hypothetical protein